MNQLEQQITDLMVKEIANERPDLQIGLDTRLIEEEVIDSLGIILLVELLQEHFDVEIDPEDVVADNFQTVADIATLVESKLANTAT